MNFEWEKIKGKLTGYAARELNACPGVSYDTDRLTHAADILLNVISTRSGYAELDDLDKTLLPALQDAFVRNIGQVSPLGAIAEQLPFFLKKVIVLCKVKAYNDIRRLPLTELYLALNMAPGFHYGVKPFEHHTADEYAKEADAVYVFAKTLEVYNQIGHTPDWDDADVTQRLRVCMAFYMHVVLTMMSELTARHPDLLKTKVAGVDVAGGDGKLLYDFICFGKSVNEARNTYLKAAVSQYLKNEGARTAEQLYEGMTDDVRAAMTLRGFERTLEKFVTAGALNKTEDMPRLYDLTAAERKRLDDSAHDYNTNLTLFMNRLDMWLDGRGLTDKREKILGILKTYLDKSIADNINEAIAPRTGDRQSMYYADALNSLMQCGVPQDQTKDVFRELVSLTRDNDILIRLAIARSIFKYSNADRLSDYAAKPHRTVFMDTSLLLYVICNKETYGQWQDASARLARSIMELRDNYRELHYEVNPWYIKEIAYQLKDAYLLMPFIDALGEEKVKSSNIFFNHYRDLKKADELPLGVDDYPAYLENMFRMSYDRVYSHDFLETAERYVTGILEGDNGIDIARIPSEVSQLYPRSADTMKQVIEKNRGTLRPKNYLQLRNDAYMGLLLFEGFYPAEPIFLSSDKTFGPYRQRYRELYHNDRADCWRLMGPAQFVNHMDLINLKIDDTAITNDILMQIESENFKARSKTIFDAISHFADIPNMDLAQHKRIVQLAYEKLVASEFDNEVELLPKDEDQITSRLSALIESINDVIADEGNRDLYGEMLRDETFTERLFTELKYQLTAADGGFNPRFFMDSLRKLIKEFKAAKANP